MDREQAVKYLQSSGFSDEQIKAIEGAFTCEDAISRKAVIDTLERMDKALDEDRTVENYKELLRECYKVLPPVNPQPKTDWIPVSERLPEDSELVLFSTKTDRVFEGRFLADNTDRQWYAFRDETFAWNNVVTAWMPLPESYKEEGSEEE